MESQAPEKIRVRTASVCHRPEVAVHSGHRSRMRCRVIGGGDRAERSGTRRPKGPASFIILRSNLRVAGVSIDGSTVDVAD